MSACLTIFSHTLYICNTQAPAARANQDMDSRFVHGVLIFKRSPLRMQYVQQSLPVHFYFSLVVGEVPMTHLPPPNTNTQPQPDHHQDATPAAAARADPCRTRGGGGGQWWR